MKNDIGRVSFDELSHYVGVFHQMGRVALDSDLNEQNELVLRLLQRLAGDAIHTGSPNEGFRVDTHLVLDRLDSRRGWSTTPAAATLFIDYFDHRVGDGSLALMGATAATKKLDLTREAPLDLSGLVEVLIAVKKPAAAGLRFVVGDGSSTHAFTMGFVATDDGWTLLRAVPGIWPAALAVNRITEYGFDQFDAASMYGIDFIKADLPLRTLLVDPELTAQFSGTPAAAVLAVDDDQRLWQRRSLRATQATRLSFALPVPLDASRARALLIGLRRTPAAAPLAMRLVDGVTPSHTLALSGATVFTQGGWEVHRFALPQAGSFTWTELAAFELSGLDASATYHLGPVLLEADPVRDLVVMGGDGTSVGAGRFHGDGLAASKESHGTYFTQADLPQADPAALAVVPEGRRRIDWACLDLWERPLSFAERPALRDVALRGIDTCTRTQLVAQVRLLAGAEVALANSAEPPTAAFAALQRIGQGTLSTKDKPAAVLDPCADPCEPAIAGPYLGEDNRLFRVEIHRAGDIGAASAAGTATFKWSRENAGSVTPLLSDAAAAATSVFVERPDLFAIGELIEVADDIMELITGPDEDRINHRAHLRGALRRITSINLDTRRVAWDDASVVDPLLMPLHSGLPRAMRAAQHAKITRWDGTAACTAGDIVLADGIVIEFGGQAFAPGDHWLFATRTVDRSVERLIDAPPRGIRHAYYKLAAIHRSRAAAAPEVVFCEDLRPRLAPLPEQDASRIAYDPGAGTGLAAIPDWDKVGTVQEAIDALARADLTGDLRLHNKLLHGMGVICGLKLRCVRADRAQVVLGKGYALDCDGDLLHNPGDRAIRLVADAQAAGLLNASNTGKVNLWIEQGAAGITQHLEAHVSQSFLSTVLEGTLIKDYIDKVILALFAFFKAQLSPFPDPTLPLSDQHKRVITLLNLIWQLVNPSTGRFLWLSKAEHDLLEQFHDDLTDLLASKTYCAMFDHLQPFPAYPYTVPTGIDTMFGSVQLHRKLKLDPSGRWAVSCGVGNQIQIYDTTRREAVLLEAFPGATNLDVQDVAFSTGLAGALRLHAVGTMASGADVDSVFATATLTSPVAPAIAPTLAWGAATVVCDIRFTTLATNANQPTWLYAIGRSDGNAALRGLYRLDPFAVPLAPTPWIVFNAAGHLSIDANGIDAVATEHGGGVLTGAFDRLRVINLNTQASSTPFLVSGRPRVNEVAVEDLVLVNGVVHVTALTGGQDSLMRFALSPAAPILPSAMLSMNGLWRIGVMPTRDLLALSNAATCSARLYVTTGGALRPTLRLPLQILPLALAVGPAGRELFALNYLSNTVNAIDIALVNSASPQTFTLDPPVTLAQYRADVLKAFTDLSGVLVQYLKDGFCDLFLVECPDCGPNDKVYLGTIEINNGRVDHICNFSKRHYAKSFRTWGYWLSALPLLPLLKTAFGKLGCMKLVP